MTGKSPKAYINELRVQEAKRLLRATSLSITMISQEIGFEHHSSFTRWFIRLEGVSSSNISEKPSLS